MTGPDDIGGRIVVGVDGSRTSAAALEWALAQAARTGAHVEAIACWLWPAAPWQTAQDVDVDLATATAHALHEVVAAAVAAVPGVQDVRVRELVLCGHPSTLLVERARAADLLVVGTRGHSGGPIGRIGSVSLHCVVQARCPVLVVQGPDLRASGPADRVTGAEQAVTDEG